MIKENSVELVRLFQAAFSARVNRLESDIARKISKADFSLKLLLLLLSSL